MGGSGPSAHLAPCAPSCHLPGDGPTRLDAGASTAHTAGMSTPRRSAAAVGATAAASALALLALAPPGAAAPGSANDQLVVAWYQSFLGRTAEAALADPDRAFWVERLDRGEPREAVLRDITRSREHAEVTTALAYEAWLGHGLDAGSEPWVVDLQRGTSPEWVAQKIASSPESVGDGEEFVEEVLDVVLGRDGDVEAGEVEYWEQVLEQHGPLSVVRGVWYSDEGVRHRLAVAYDDLLGRGVDDEGARFWTGSVMAGELEVRIRVASTEEYASRLGEVRPRGAGD